MNGPKDSSAPVEDLPPAQAVTGQSEAQRNADMHNANLRMAAGNLGTTTGVGRTLNERFAREDEQAITAAKMALEQERIEASKYSPERTLADLQVQGQQLVNQKRQDDLTAVPSPEERAAAQADLEYKTLRNEELKGKMNQQPDPKQQRMDELKMQKAEAELASIREEARTRPEKARRDAALKLAEFNNEVVTREGVTEYSLSDYYRVTRGADPEIQKQPGIEQQLQIANDLAAAAGMRPPYPDVAPDPAPDADAAPAADGPPAQYPNARRGTDPQGNPGWYIMQNGQALKVG